MTSCFYFIFHLVKMLSYKALPIKYTDLFTSTDCPYFLRIRRINYALRINNEFSTEIGHNWEFYSLRKLSSFR